MLAGDRRGRAGAARTRRFRAAAVDPGLQAVQPTGRRLRSARAVEQLPSVMATRMASRIFECLAAPSRSKRSTRRSCSAAAGHDPYPRGRRGHRAPQPASSACSWTNAPPTAPAGTWSSSDFWKSCWSNACAGAASAADALPSGLLAGMRDPALARVSARDARRHSRRMDRGRARKTSRHVAVGLCGALCRDPRLRSNRISSRWRMALARML